MKLRILPSATKDLSDGFRFYEAQAEGLGEYFLESLFSDIDSPYSCKNIGNKNL